MDNVTREKIDQYVLHKMDEKARQAFELELASDETLREEVRLAKEAYEMLDAIGDQRMRATLDQIHEKVVHDSPVTFSKRTRVALLVTVVALLALIYYFFFVPSTTPAIDPQRAYLQYYESYPLSLVARDDSQTIDIQQINALYKNEKYQEALPLIEKLLHETSDTKLQMIAGVSALEVEDYTKALQYFSDLIDQKDPLFQYQAMWYAAMTSLKLGDTTLAKTYLQSLITSDSSFKQKASQELLQKLK